MRSPPPGSTAPALSERGARAEGLTAGSPFARLRLLCLTPYASVFRFVFGPRSSDRRGLQNLAAGCDPLEARFDCGIAPRFLAQRKRSSLPLREILACPEGARSASRRAHHWRSAPSAPRLRFDTIRACRGVESPPPCHGGDRGFKSHQARFDYANASRLLAQRKRSSLPLRFDSTPLTRHLAHHRRSAPTAPRLRRDKQPSAKPLGLIGQLVVHRFRTPDIPVQIRVSPLRLRAATPRSAQCNHAPLSAWFVYVWRGVEVWCLPAVAPAVGCEGGSKARFSGPRRTTCHKLRAVLCQLLLLTTSYQLLTTSARSAPVACTERSDAQHRGVECALSSNRQDA